jgi:hypothetical protein
MKAPLDLAPNMPIGEHIAAGAASRAERKYGYQTAACPGGTGTQPGQRLASFLLSQVLLNAPPLIALAESSSRQLTYSPDDVTQCRRTGVQRS